MDADKRGTPYCFVVNGVAGSKVETLVFDRSFRCIEMGLVYRYPARMELHGRTIKGPLRWEIIEHFGTALPVMPTEFSAGNYVKVRFENHDRRPWRWFRSNPCRLELRGYWLREAKDAEA